MTAGTVKTGHHRPPGGSGLLEPPDLLHPPHEQLDVHALCGQRLDSIRSAPGHKRFRFGALLVLALNVNAVEIARSLYTDEATRTSVVIQASNAAQCEDKEPAQCLRDLRDEIGELRASGLPIGWGTVAERCADSSAKCNWLESRGLANPTAGAGSDLLFFFGILGGWALVVLAIVPGARFWFDALSRLGSLRSTGPKPDNS